METTIIKAVQMDGFIILTLQTGEAAPFTYTLYDDDPYGNAPAYRAELQRMVDAGEIVIEPAPTGDPETPLNDRIINAPDDLFGGPTLGEIFNGNA
jgi:hypothetical protein